MDERLHRDPEAALSTERIMTESIAEPSMLPDGLQEELVRVHGEPVGVRADMIDRMCREHAEHARGIRDFLASLTRAHAFVIAAVQDAKHRQFSRS